MLEASLRADCSDRRHAPLSIIVTAVIVKRTIFVLAAHPFFLPARLCPDDKTWRDDHGRLDFETEWGSLAHASVSDPTLTTEKSIEAVPDIGRGGLFIRSPYAELALCLVVQKMLTRFRTIFCYMDAAKQLSAGHCQVNRNPLFFDAKSIRANTTNQRLRWHVDQWNLQEIS